jgi:hypothetical protein
MDNPKRTIWLIAVTVCTILMVGAVCGILGRLEIRNMQIPATTGAATRRAVRTTQTQLIEQHGVEVTGAITNFEIRWSRPLTAAEVEALVTSPFSDFSASDMLSVPVVTPTGMDLVILNAHVTHLEILEYRDGYFKALSSMTVTVQAVERLSKTPLGPPMEAPRCGLYAFKLEEGTWKLAGRFQVPLGARGHRGVEDAWSQIPTSHKDILGDLPEGGLCHW